MKPLKVRRETDAEFLYRIRSWSIVPINLEPPSEMINRYGYCVLQMPQNRVIGFRFSWDEAMKIANEFAQYHYFDLRKT